MTARRAQRCVLLCVLALSGCAVAGDAHRYAGQVEQGLAIQVPDLRQPTRTACGIAALASVMAYHRGAEHPPSELLEHHPHASDRGYSLGELRDVALHHDFVAYVVPGDRSFLRSQLDRGRPLIVPVQVRPDGRGGLPARLAGPLLDRQSAGDSNHYLTVVGLDDERGTVIAMDPARGPVELAFEDFAAGWEPMNRAVLLVGLAEPPTVTAPR